MTVAEQSNTLYFDKSGMKGRLKYRERKEWRLISIKIWVNIWLLLWVPDRLLALRIFWIMVQYFVCRRYRTIVQKSDLSFSIVTKRAISYDKLFAASPLIDFGSWLYDESFFPDGLIEPFKFFEWCFEGLCIWFFVNY